MYEGILKRYKMSGADVDMNTPTILELCHSSNAIARMKASYRKSDWHRPPFKEMHYLSLYGLSLDLCTHSDVGHFIREANDKLSAHHDAITKIDTRVFPRGPHEAPTDAVLMNDDVLWIAKFTLIGDSINGGARYLYRTRVIAVAERADEAALVEDVVGLALLFYCSGARTLRQVMRWLKHQYRIRLGECTGYRLNVAGMCCAIRDPEAYEALMHRLELWEKVKPGMETSDLAELAEDMRQSAVKAVNREKSAS